MCVCVYGALLKINCCCCVCLAASKGNRQAQKKWGEARATLPWHQNPWQTRQRKAKQSWQPGQKNKIRQNLTGNGVWVQKQNQRASVGAWRVSNVRQCKWRKCKNAKLIQGHTSTKNAQLQANVAVSRNKPSDTPAKYKSNMKYIRTLRVQLWLLWHLKNKGGQNSRITRL